MKRIKASELFKSEKTKLALLTLPVAGSFMFAVYAFAQSYTGGSYSSPLSGSALSAISSNSLYADLNNTFYTNASGVYNQSSSSINQMLAGSNSVPAPVASQFLWFATLGGGGNMSGFKLPSDTYTQDVYALDSTASLLGYLYNPPGGVWWKNQDTFSGYMKQVNSLYQSLSSDLNISYNSASTVNPASSSTLLSGLLTLYSAGQSFGYIFQPDATKQTQNQNNPASYAFRVMQQTQRDAVIKTFASQITLLNTELANLYNLYHTYCQALVAPGSISSFTINLPTPPNNCDNIDGSWVCYYNVNTDINQLAQQQQDLKQYQMTVQCGQWLTQITTLKTAITQAELQLATLSAQYGLLSDKEKSRYE